MVTKQMCRIDPQHLLLLGTSWEAVERAGIAPSSLAGTLTTPCQSRACTIRSSPRRR
jgi:acyl transferase domain-containing protein